MSIAIRPALPRNFLAAADFCFLEPAGRNQEYSRTRARFSSSWTSDALHATLWSNSSGSGLATRTRVSKSETPSYSNYLPRPPNLHEPLVQPDSPASAGPVPGPTTHFPYPMRGTSTTTRHAMLDSSRIPRRTGRWRGLHSKFLSPRPPFVRPHPCSSTSDPDSFGAGGTPSGFSSGQKATDVLARISHTFRDEAREFPGVARRAPPEPKSP
jgi:hypothetical protein